MIIKRKINFWVTLKTMLVVGELTIKKLITLSYFAHEHTHKQITMKVFNKLQTSLVLPLILNFFNLFSLFKSYTFSNANNFSIVRKASMTKLSIEERKMISNENTLLNINLER